MKNVAISKIKCIAPNSNFKFVCYVVLGAISSLISVAFALAVKWLINSVEYQQGEKAIVVSAIVLSAVVLLNFALGVTVRLLGDKICTLYEKKIKSAVISGYLASDYKNASLVTSGDLVSRIDGDSIKVASVRTNLLPNIVSTLVRLVGTVTAMFVLQPILTLLIIGVSLIFVALSFAVKKVVSKLHKNTRKGVSMESSFISEVSSNVLAVKTFNAEDKISSVANGKFEFVRLARLKEKYFLSFVSSTINLCFTAVYTLVAIFGVYGLYKGTFGVDFGVLTAMLQLVLQIRSPISSISGFFTARAEMEVSSERLVEIMSESEGKTELSSFDKMVLSEVSFSYGKGEVMKNLSFEFNKGDTVLINGASGIGKTTLAKVISGLYPVSNGKISIASGGCEYEPSKIKGLFAFVPQGNMIFSGTVKENVAFGKEYDEEKLKFALKTACLYQTVDSFEFKEDTVLGGKFRLSEGQEQRLAIARAVYSDSEVIVLDEPTSALDIKTEEEVVKNLISLNKTLVVISHRPSFEKVATVKVEL